MTHHAAAKKDTQKLQRAIVDGLEDVKAHDIQVFDTEHLSPLFERVIVASGTSNRQTKALASSVRDAVREAGFPKPRVEGEDNGEWIIVDCGAAVAHIMQPAIRQYYHLEEIWGDKPVRLKFGAPKPVFAQASEEQPAARKTSAKKTSAKKTTATAKTATAKTAAAKTAKTATAKTGSGRAPAKGAKTPARPAAKATAKKAGAGHASRAPARTPAKAPAKKAPGRSSSGGSGAGRATGKSATRRP
jgi:ribosome-associated protein